MRSGRSSLACGLVDNIYLLVLLRALQSVGAVIPLDVLLGFGIMNIVNVLFGAAALGSVPWCRSTPGSVTGWTP